jgi:four helix bundle protein
VENGKWEEGNGKFIMRIKLLPFRTKSSTMLNLAHKQLDVYKIGLKLVQEVYNLTKIFPKEEQFVLVSQLRRAAISVCSNLAEGSSRRTKPEKKRFYEISRSSLVEIDTQFEIALVLEYLHAKQLEKFQSYLESVFRMLSKMISNLNE